MKALSVRQPYADAIMRGEKITEYRSWYTKYRGKLLICSTKKPIINQGNYLYGYALCVVELLKVDVTVRPKYVNHNGFLLIDRHLIKPFPVKGQQRLFNVDDALIEYLEER